MCVTGSTDAVIFRQYSPPQLAIFRVHVYIYANILHKVLVLLTPSTHTL